jgi:hypothetical protein
MTCVFGIYSTQESIIYAVTIIIVMLRLSSIVKGSTLPFITTHTLTII